MDAMPPMTIPAFSPAWAEALLLAVNGDQAYRAAASGWTNPVALVVEPGLGISLGAAVQLNLAAGSCLSAESMAAERVTAPFVLSAALAIWKDIIGGRTDPFTAVARGTVTLTRGSMFTLMLHARGARALLASAQRIETLWP
jgi:putative sterol carrier protein